MAKITLYVSKNHSRLNGRPFVPESITEYLCLNPYYKCQLERPAKVLTDSGAFQDVDGNKRLTFEDALNRQLQYEKKVGYTSEYLVSYDRLVDEQLIDGSKQKQRWEEDAAEGAVEETVAAAEFLANKREDLRPRKLILSCQGVTIEQYIRCAKRMMPLFTEEDCFGFGGFCIIGQRQRSVCVDGMKYPEQFVQIFEKVAPLLKRFHIRRAHIFGVSYLPALRQIVPIANKNGIELSIDTSSIERNSVIEGKVWSDEGFRLKLGRQWKYTGPDPVPLDHWHPNLLAHENIKRAVRTFRNLKGEKRIRWIEQMCLF
jgi:hypothetical protein